MVIADLMTRRRVRQVPVVDLNGRLVGADLAQRSRP
jgi:CBS domain-containing protein